MLQNGNEMEQNMMRFNKTRIVFILICVSFSNFSFSQKKIQIESKVKSKENKLEINEFYFIHHIFADAFFMTTLNKDVDTSNIESMLIEVFPKLSTEFPVTVKIKRQSKPDGWLEFTVVNSETEGATLFMRTNFIQKTKEFTSNLKDKNLFVRKYFIKGNKLVYRKDIYTKEEEETRRKESQHTLAEYYLFNDRIEDDTLVLGLLDPIFSSDSTSNLDKLYAKLYYTEYYLSVGNFTEADKKLKELVAFYSQNKDSIPSAYELIVKLAGIEVYLNHRIRTK
jgi:hypothetical protein